MKYYFYTIKNLLTKNVQGFVLPFTLFICAIMLLISTSISSVLQKQIYFSQIARESQAAYYAADDAIACVLSIDETYTDSEGFGVFPFNSADPVDSTVDTATMGDTVNYTNTQRNSQSLVSLYTTPESILCSQSHIFDTAAGFTISPIVFKHTVPDPNALGFMITENGRTSTFTMKMPLGDGTFRCAKVTVNKTASYRQIIAQGLSRCDRPDGSVERAVIDTTVTK